MTEQELDTLLDSQRHIEWQDEEDAVLFRNVLLPWYQNDPNRATKVTRQKLQELTCDELLRHINWGLDVEYITRVTGYFAKTRSFNPGKLAEFKDRHRVEVR
ncbi:MAG: anaerobic ribonucleoside-triphosphate reductase [Pseudomonadota bacterium]